MIYEAIVVALIIGAAKDKDKEMQVKHHLQCNALIPRRLGELKFKCNCKELFATNIPNIPIKFKRHIKRTRKQRSILEVARSSLIYHRAEIAIYHHHIADEKRRGSFHSKIITRHEQTIIKHEQAINALLRAHPILIYERQY